MALTLNQTFQTNIKFFLNSQNQINLLKVTIVSHSLHFRKFPLFILVFLFSIMAKSQEKEVDPAKAAQNPLANVYSLPLQNNTDFSIGDYSKTSNTLNIQPVIPVVLGENGWLLINRAVSSIW